MNNNPTNLSAITDEKIIEAINSKKYEEAEKLLKEKNLKDKAEINDAFTKAIDNNNYSKAEEILTKLAEPTTDLPRSEKKLLQDTFKDRDYAEAQRILNQLTSPKNLQEQLNNAINKQDYELAHKILNQIYDPKKMKGIKVVNDIKDKLFVAINDKNYKNVETHLKELAKEAHEKISLQSLNHPTSKQNFLELLVSGAKTPVEQKKVNEIIKELIKDHTEIEGVTKKTTRPFVYHIDQLGTTLVNRGVEAKNYELVLFFVKKSMFTLDGIPDYLKHLTFDSNQKNSLEILEKIGSIYNSKFIQLLITIKKTFGSQLAASDVHLMVTWSKIASGYSKEVDLTEFLKKNAALPIAAQKSGSLEPKKISVEDRVATPKKTRRDEKVVFKKTLSPQFDSSYTKITSHTTKPNSLNQEGNPSTTHTANPLTSNKIKSTTTASAKPSVATKATQPPENRLPSVEKSSSSDAEKVLVEKEHGTTPTLT